MHLHLECGLQPHFPGPDQPKKAATVRVGGIGVIEVISLSPGGKGYVHGLRGSSVQQGSAVLVHVACSCNFEILVFLHYKFNG